MGKRAVVLYTPLVLVLASWLTVCGLILSGRLEVRWVEPCHEQGTYPQPGRVEGTTAFYHESKAPFRANPRYPEWLRGGAAGGWADNRSRYRYTTLVGPTDAGLPANRVAVGTLELEPRTTYPAHNHPAAEVYIITEGEADWYVDDEKQTVGKGSVILHRPYAVHGWVNKSNEKLKAIWIWWPEGQGVPDVLDRGARFTNPERDGVEEHALPFAAPLPPLRRP